MSRSIRDRPISGGRSRISAHADGGTVRHGPDSGFSRGGLHSHRPLGAVTRVVPKVYGFSGPGSGPPGAYGSGPSAACGTGPRAACGPPRLAATRGSVRTGPPDAGRLPGREDTGEVLITAVGIFAVGSEPARRGAAVP